MPRSSSLSMALLASLACLLAGCSRPATGHCSGTFQGEVLDADLDPESEQHLVKPPWCGPYSLRWKLSYGQGAFTVDALSADVATNRILDKTLYASQFDEFEVQSFWSSPALTHLLVSLPANYPSLDKQIAGSMTLDFEDGSHLECTFDLPRGDDEGPDLYCPSGGGGDLDDD